MRKRLTIVFAVVFPVVIGLYFVAPQIFDFLLRPVLPILPKDVSGHPSVVHIGILQPMMVKFGLGVWAGVVVCSPVIIWQAMAFFLPALKPKERKWFVPTFIAMLVLFVMGVVFCYTLILQASFQWLAGEARGVAPLLAEAGDLVSVVEFFLLGFGVAFETPVVVFYLVYFNVIPYKKLRQNWRVVYVVTFIVAAGITPDWSPVSMFGLAGAMIILYEISLATVRIVLNKKIKKQAALAALEAAELEAEDDEGEKGA